MFIFIPLGVLDTNSHFLFYTGSPLGLSVFSFSLPLGRLLSLFVFLPGSPRVGLSLGVHPSSYLAPSLPASLPPSPAGALSLSVLEPVGSLWSGGDAG